MSIADKKESAVTKLDEALDRIVYYFDNNHFESELTRRIACKTSSNLDGCETALACYLEKTTESALRLMTGLWWNPGVGNTLKHTKQVSSL